MSDFARNHVGRIFKDAGYDLVSMSGDRGGIVQGDGLRLVVKPRIHEAAKNFTGTDYIASMILEDAEISRPLHLSLYGGSVSVDLEGVYFNEVFVEHLKEECETLYYKAQNDVDAIFEAEDGTDSEWDGGLNAYVSAAEEFVTELDEGQRVFIRIVRIADQSYDAYDSGDEADDRFDAEQIVAGNMAHGSLRVETYEIPPEMIDGKPGFSQSIEAAGYDFSEFTLDRADSVIDIPGVSWTRSESGHYLLDLASEVAYEDREDVTSKALAMQSTLRWFKAEADMEGEDSAPSA